MRVKFAILLTLLTAVSECFAGGSTRTHIFGAEDMGGWPLPPTGREAEKAVLFAMDGVEKCDEVEPRALAVVSGSFSAPGWAEKIFTVETGGCGISVSAFGSRRLVLTRDGKPVASAETGGEVLKKFDVDGDGRDEFLLSWGGCESGTCRRWADIARFGDSVEIISKLGVVYRSDCGAGEGIRIKDVVVRSSGGKLVFEETRIDKRCEPTNIGR